MPKEVLAYFSIECRNIRWSLIHGACPAIILIKYLSKHDHSDENDIITNLVMDLLRFLV